MKSLGIILIGLFASWHWSDLSSTKLVYGALAPVGVMVFSIALALWLVIKAGAGKKADDSGHYIGSDAGGFDGGDGGGDGGC